MADNCLSMDTWTVYSPLQDTSWMSDAFGLDNEALTRALQATLSNDSSTPNSYSNSVQFHPQPNPNSNFVVDSGIRTRDPNPIISTSSISGKIKKRKSRASKKSSTTYITADPANFRQLVQQVTGGVRFGGDSGVPVLRPEPQRAGLVLPTLDTSSPLLRKGSFSFSAAPPTGYISVGSVGDGSGSVSGSGFRFDAFSTFPTLESWSAM